MPLIPIAASNVSGNRHSSATALNAPIEAPAVTIRWAEPPMSARIAGTSSWRTAWWNWLSSHMRYSGLPVPLASALPATESQE